MMKCEQARLLIGADPSAVTPVVEAHVAGCGDCADYWREMHTLDGELRLAMRWPREAGAASGKIVPLRPVAAAAAALLRRPAGKDDGVAGSAGGAAAGLAASAPRSTARRWALAASVLLAGVLATTFIVLRPPEALAAAVVAHMGAEPDAWQRQRPIPQSVLDLVLRRAGVRLDRVRSGEIVYAHSCYVRGREVPHLVIATPRGPVTVLVLRGERVRGREAFDEGGYSGVLMPVNGGGAIAVLSRGDAGVDVDAAARAVLAAVQFDDP